MIQKFQRFGGAMFTPALLFSFSGLVLALSIVLTNPIIVGNIANEGTHWYNFWKIVEAGAWTIFNQMEILFVVGLAVGLAKMSNARAAMEALVIYLTFNYFLSAILGFYGHSFGVDFSQEVGGISGLKYIAGIKTLDTGILGAILLSGLSVWIHNKYFNKKLPEVLGVFQGSSFVVIIGFIVMLPLAFLTAIVWPKFQLGISSTQEFLVASGVFGVWLYTFLERILIPTGLHHFIYAPFIFGPAVVESGIVIAWLEGLASFANDPTPLIYQFPEGGFALHGNSKVFGSLGIAIAFYSTANEDKKKKTLSILIPATLTAMLAGITEPLEFTFLFVAPMLFFVHSILAATLAATLFSFGVVGDFGSGLIDFIGRNWIPLMYNHSDMIFTQIVIGLIFTCIYAIVFRFLILKYDLLTPGREKDEEVKLYSKEDLKQKKTGKNLNLSPNYIKASGYLEAFGGKDNIESATNCATRLRVLVKDSTLVKDDIYFKEFGAHGVVRNDRSFQVIVGLSVGQICEEFKSLL